MLFIPPCGLSAIEENVGDTSTEFGTSVTAGGSAHTKNTTYATLIAATARDSYGITIMVSDTAVANTRTGVLVDIAIGAASSEVVIIPNLMAGNQAASTSNGIVGSCYFFPLFVAAGVRLSATAQAAIASDTVRVAVWMHQYPVPGQYYGRRVTAYGADTAASTGTSMSPGQNVYATDVVLSASTANKIKCLQIGTDMLTDTTGTTVRGLIRLTVDAAVIANDIPYCEGTAVESTLFTPTNLILSEMDFRIPAGVSLEVSAMRNVAAEARGWIAYGVE